MWSLQSDHNSATQRLWWIWNSDRVITSQITQVKLWWENTTVFFCRPHEKDSSVWSLSTADQKSLFERNAPSCKSWNKQKTVPFVCLVKSKNTLSVQPLSVSITSEDIFVKILHPWWFNGADQDKSIKMVIKIGALDLQSLDLSVITKIRHTPGRISAQHIFTFGLYCQFYHMRQ